MSGRGSTNKTPDRRSSVPGLQITGSAVRFNPREQPDSPSQRGERVRPSSASPKRYQQEEEQLTKLQEKVDSTVSKALKNMYPGGGAAGGGGGVAVAGGGGVAVAGGGGGDGGLNVLQAEDDLDMHMVEDPNIDENFEDYMKKVKTTIFSDKNKLIALLPRVDKVLNEISATLFGAGAPLGDMNPNADEGNCDAVYPICLQVTQEDLRTYGLNYGMALRKIYIERNINSIPYIGRLIANIKLASGAASLIISILSYRYTLIWVNNRLASLGSVEILKFLTAFSAFCINPQDRRFDRFQSEHKVVFDILSQVTSGVFSMETCILLLHQFISRQNRLVAAGAAAAGAAAAGGGRAVPPPRTILGWNLSFLQPVEGIIRTSGSAIFKMCKPNLCWMGFDATLPIQAGVTTVDVFLSNILKNTLALLHRMSPNENLLVVAHLTVKFGHTFSAFDGSVDKTEFKTVMVQERNAYVKRVVDSLMRNRSLSYSQAREMLLDVFPYALDFCISSDAVEGSSSVASARSTGSSLWTVLGSTASSLYRANQAAMHQAHEDNTIASRITSSLVWLLKKGGETILYKGTLGVATAFGADEPAVFTKKPNREQEAALHSAVHAVTVFDEWVNTVKSDEVFEMMSKSEILKTLGGTLTKEHVNNGVDRVKLFCRLKSDIKVLNDGRLLYLVNPETVTGLKDILRTMEKPIFEAEVLNGCVSAILELQMLMEREEQIARKVPDDAAQRSRVEDAQLVLNSCIPPAVVIESVINNPEAVGEVEPSDSFEYRDRVEGELDQELNQGGDAAAHDDMSEQGGDAAAHPAADDMPEQGGDDAAAHPADDDMSEQRAGRSRSRKRSASKRTRRKAKKPSKKLKRKSRRYVRRRRSTRRKN
jgi:hypothetical protein